MNTQCTSEQLILQGLDKRQIVVRNDSKVNSSDGGFLLLGKLDDRFGIIKRLASCFTDTREPYRIKHSLTSLLAQRIFALVQGYEDINDHEQLRDDPLLQYVSGANRQGAGKSTLNRLELGKEPDDVHGDRYTKIRWDDLAIEKLLCDIFIESFERPPDQIVLDFDATDVPLHGDQEMKFFHGYYDHYCYLPLYVFSGDHILAARLRPANIDGCAGTEEILRPLVHQIREAFPGVRIIFRGDSGFCRERILSLCEDLEMDYIVGLAKNDRLQGTIAPYLEQARQMYMDFGKACRIFTRFNYRTRSSWSRTRSVIAKAEHLAKGSNPRFIVTSLEGDEQGLYENLYCARGDMENRIKEQQLDLFASRTSSGWMSANQLRLWFSAFAYTFYLLLRTFIPSDSHTRKSMPSTIRISLLKVAAAVRLSTRRLWISLPESFPYWDIWRSTALAI